MNKLSRGSLSSGYDLDLWDNLNIPMTLKYAIYFKKGYFSLSDFAIKIPFKEVFDSIWQ